MVCYLLLGMNYLTLSHDETAAQHFIYLFLTFMWAFFCTLRAYGWHDMEGNQGRGSLNVTPASDKGWWTGARKGE